MGSKPKGLGYQPGLDALEYEATKLRAAVDSKILESIASLEEARFSPSIGELHAGLLKASGQIDWCFGRIHEVKMVQWVRQHPYFKQLKQAYDNQQAQSEAEKAKE